MWHAGWVWLRQWRGKPAVRARRVGDAADMGIDIALDASLHSRLPPLMEEAATCGHRRTDQASPLGTDLRSSMR